MSRSPDDEKRKRILENAYAEFNLKGFRSTTIKSIAEKAGVAPGSVYTYFADKTDLFHGTVSYLWGKIFTEAESALDTSKPFAQRFFHLYSRLEELLCASPVFLAGMVATESRRRALRQNIQTLSAKLVPLFREDGAKPLGNFKGSDQEETNVVSILLTGTLFQGVLGEPVRIRQVFEEIGSLLRNRLGEKV